jgi:hypothetical protein
VHDNSINPYETPKGIGEARDIRENGVGVWRDGDLIVAHAQAKLPPICVKSGEKADGAFPLLIKGRVIRVPLSEECFFSFILLWRRLAVGAGIVLLATLAATAALYSYWWELLGVCVVVAIAAIGLGWVALAAPAGLLRCTKREHGYWWFSGACHSYLAQLPRWPDSRD